MTKFKDGLSLKRNKNKKCSDPWELQRSMNLQRGASSRCVG
eukprot:CAMPEP_0116562480 /NCGR_PEP_ID=MMETSP0397-20121206/12178_1 /TAXON_ID=216820 /ORGANISM="Cyclophora tenuis, Strain ECT3854" /LENGTH=40 /DNA_ID= /DNA_START= /DNA_END= /DNA_ORIENTATION=